MKFSSRVVLPTILAVFIVFFVSASSGAQILEVTSRTGLGGTDLVNWGQFGISYTNVAQSSTFTSNNGLTGQISTSDSSQMQIRQQENGWSGNFTQGDYALWAQTPGGYLNIAFNNPVSAAGANIMSNPYGSFNATITAYDSSNNQLGTFTEAGDSNGNNDGSAIFLGVSSTMANISKITYTTDTSTNSSFPGFAINQLGIRQNPSTAVPEPGDLAFLLAGFLPGLAFLMKRRYAKAV
jgi:hypothetical protein